MQKQAKQAALICLIITPIFVWVGFRIGALCNTKNLLDSLSYALNEVFIDIVRSPIFFQPNEHSITLGLIFAIIV